MSCEEHKCRRHTTPPPLCGASYASWAQISATPVGGGGYPWVVVAERAFTSRSTLQKVEAGNANVSIGIYAAVLQALGLLDGLGEIADIARDSVGQTLASAELPKRVRLKRTSGPTDNGRH
jgi:hypothetical protein